MRYAIKNGTSIGAPWATFSFAIMYLTGIMNGSVSIRHIFKRTLSSDAKNCRMMRKSIASDTRLR